MFGFFSKSRRRRQLLTEPVPAASERILGRNLGVYPLLPDDERQRLLRISHVVAGERSFVGLRGLALSDEVRITIAGQAALLLLGQDDYFFDRVTTVYVQPSVHRSRAMHDLGGAALVVENVPLLGQAFEDSVVRLAFDAALFGGQVPDDGENVVLHEFAHHLDALDGVSDGIPPLPRERQRERWSWVFDEVIEELRADQRAGDELLLAEHATESPAELFAYATEVFFEQPWYLADWHSELFECLLGFYKTDPRSWFAEPSEGK